MLSFENQQQVSTRNLPHVLLASLALVLMMFPYTASAESHPCEGAFVNLQGELGVVMNRGGLWTLMEQTEGLSEKSMIGMQADSKLARLVGQFGILCESKTKPTKELFISTQNLVGEARMIFNPRSSRKELVELIIKLNKKMDVFIAKFE